jgi:NADH dehydrogenase
MPFWIAKLVGTGFDLGNAISLGIIRGPITRDQVLNLENDNVVSRKEKTFKALGIEPKALEIILSEYLWKYRPAGEFSDPEKQN